MFAIIEKLKNLFCFRKQPEIKENEESLEKAIINVQTIILDIDRKLKVYNKALKKLNDGKKVKKKYKKEVKKILKFYNKKELMEIIAMLDKNLANLKFILVELYKQRELAKINDSLNLFNIGTLEFDSSIENVCEKIQKQVDLINAYKTLE